MCCNRNGSVHTHALSALYQVELKGFAIRQFKMGLKCIVNEDFMMINIFLMADIRWGSAHPAPMDNPTWIQLYKTRKSFNALFQCPLENVLLVFI